MSKHTPGPWSAQQRQDQGVYDFFALNKPSPFATAQASSSIEAEANARLIAAAPELLDALQEIVEAQKGGYLGWSHIDAASAAIAKATGA